MRPKPSSRRRGRLPRSHSFARNDNIQQGEEANQPKQTIRSIRSPNPFSHPFHPLNSFPESVSPYYHIYIFDRVTYNTLRGG